MVKMNSVIILGYGGYVPRYRVRAEEIARVWGEEQTGLPVEEKAVASLDEDTITMAVEAARIALKRAGIPPSRIGAVHVGTESKPYAVKPCGTIVAEAIGATPKVTAADFEFACKAGTEALQFISSLVEAGRIDYGLAIGSDTAQGRPRDALEYTAASGAAAFIIGRDKDKGVAEIEAWTSYVTDTPDFWRREYERYPRHTARFTGDPAYFHHIVNSVKALLDDEGYNFNDIDYVIFHQPNVRFPFVAAKLLGVDIEKVKPGMVAGTIGNTYAACSLLGLVKVLDQAKPGQRILLASFGSGAGSDSYIIRVLDGVELKRELAPTLEKFIERKTYIDYITYAKNRRKIIM
ncbi:MAG: hydroxymethylglutaryl-CoA synthase [Aigarchaeota archaeon]|nr:hydroxymethylglutaryl-CoA synthase [Aigarchaeota archaeon]MCX8192529.1 hydroxymethylglutaryl-CoA synthase [Nitrososphaeria archaeon]MDW7985735.1 hydroxymethylglutaryl-CoA synthase [Nitrososphaerota archaeon]